TAERLSASPYWAGAASSMSCRATALPSSASRSAMRRPSPRPDPVTSATAPVPSHGLLSIVLPTIPPKLHTDSLDQYRLSSRAQVQNPGAPEEKGHSSLTTRSKLSVYTEAGNARRGWGGEWQRT